MSFLGLDGIDIPVVLAPMGGAVGPELCAAVSNAGALGTIPAWWGDSSTALERTRATRALTGRPFAVNLNLNYPQASHLDAAIDEGARIVSFFWGIEPRLMKRAKDASLMVLQTVSSAAEARQAVEAGVDAVVAQGWEAGGHVAGSVATLALVPAVVDAVPGIPVIAAGGIADGRGVAAVLALGASGAWIGTRFLLAHEAVVSETNRAKLKAAGEADTVMGLDPNPTWLDSGLRWIGAEPAGAYAPEGRQLAGQGVALVKREQPAAEIVREIWAEARAVITALAQRAV